ncbi:MAG: FISUMP domain-containing protein [Bacteroidota bacterium]|nr:FISUMP domain-containing protein [Bacteroidota bacterium]
MKHFKLLLSITLLLFGLSSVRGQSTLVIKSNISGAVVKLDGQKKGETPCNIMIEHGTYKVTAVKKINDYEQFFYSGEVSIGRKEVKEITLTLKKGLVPEHEKKTMAKEDTIIDKRDNQEYRTIEIGSQIWMAENLNFDTGDGNCCYDSISDNCEIYGRLYTWTAAQNSCPQGWHLPSDDEWIQLEKSLGMPSSEAGETGYRGTNQGKQLMKDGITHFNVIMAGTKSFYDGSFSNLTVSTNFWTSSAFDESNAYNRYFKADKIKVGRGYDDKANSFSVRCIKD